MKSSILIFALILVISACAVVAGEYHSGGIIACSDCHTTHYSERGTLPEGAEPGGPFSGMLLVSTTNMLCLSCHDGTDPTAPDVLAPVTMYDGSGSEFSGAGYFTGMDGVVSIYGHDLGVENQVPFSSPPRTTTLSCASCHNPHGTAFYRNLIPDPDSSGSGVGITLDTDVFENVHPAIPPSRNVSIESYRAGNMGYKTGISQWCADCHSSLQPDLPGNPPAHFMRHPSEASFVGADYHVDESHWIEGSGDGFGAVTGDVVEGVPRLRFQVSDATDFNTSQIVSSANEVFCYSCHMAHGGGYKSSLIWPYNGTGESDLYSGCQQCHYK